MIYLLLFILFIFNVIFAYFLCVQDTELTILNNKVAILEIKLLLCEENHDNI